MFLINTKKCLKIFDSVYVSSDSPEILSLAESVGAIGIIRGEDLCGDTPNILVYKHAGAVMGDIDGIVAVQANSPSIKPEIIKKVKTLMEMGLSEVMTCHRGGKLYGSVWALTTERLEHYSDPYNPEPVGLVYDESVDIHTEEDLKQALCQ